MDGDQEPSRLFHQEVQDRIRDAVAQALADTKFDWSRIAPFLDLARPVLAAEIREAGRIRLHALRAQGDAIVEAEEAFVALSAGDPARPWLSETRWLSEMALAEGDAEQVRRIAEAMERSLDKVKAWLAQRAQSSGAAEP